MSTTTGAAAEAAPRGAHASDWLRPASYWQPTHFTVTAWLEHAPFAFWLMDALKPRVVVELGTHFGYSYFVFCEAVTRLGLDTQTYALDTWQGDDQAGLYGEEVYEFVATTNARQYGSFSTLLRGYFDDSLDAIDDGTIDLLHIDGRHGYEDVRHDFEAWRPKLSPRGVVLFHDVAESQEGFGVWRLWNELSSTYPSFAFAHAHGLGVLGVGEQLPREMERFFSAAGSAGNDVRRTYEELGSVLTARAHLETLPAEVDSLKAHIASVDQARIRAEDTVHALNTELARVRLENDRHIEEFRASTSWKITAPVRAFGKVLRRKS